MTANPAQPYDRHEGSTMAEDITQLNSEVRHLREVNAAETRVRIIEQGRAIDAERRVRELEAELQSAKEMNERTATLERCQASLKQSFDAIVKERDSLREQVTYHKGMAEQYRGELNAAIFEMHRDSFPVGYVVDGTGADAKAPAEASPREIAERAAQETYEREMALPQPSRGADIAKAIAAGVEAYHHALNEER